MLLTLSTALSLLTGELACRIWGAMIGDRTPGRFLVNDVTLGWSNRPGFDGRHTTEDFDVAVRFERDPHWLPRTHAAVALKIAEFLLRERLLED